MYFSKMHLFRAKESLTEESKKTATVKRLQSYDSKRAA
jgi:hypothetical protein